MEAEYFGGLLYKVLPSLEWPYAKYLLSRISLALTLLDKRFEQFYAVHSFKLNLFYCSFSYDSISLKFFLCFVSLGRSSMLAEVIRI